MSSGLSINNPVQWTQLFTECAAKTTHSGIRSFFITYVAPHCGTDYFAQDINCDYFSARSETDRSDRIDSLLGTQRQSLVFSSGLCPDAGVLAAAAGTVEAGGFFLLDLSKLRVAPEEIWQQDVDTADAQCESQSNSQCVKNSHCKRSVRRMIRLLLETANRYPETVHVVNLRNYLSRSKAALAAGSGSLPELAHGRSLNQDTDSNTAAHREQEVLLKKSCQHLFTHDQSCILIKGRRGRGKSSLLGRIAHSLKGRHLNFKVTALRKSALGSFEQGGECLDTHYIDVQNALRDKCDILLIDEAASLPIAQLDAFLRHCKHIVLCTTTEGYEVAGRAFDIRLHECLKNTNKSVLTIEPAHSWRWGNDDPLEYFIDRLLLKNVRTPTATSSDFAKKGQRANTAYSDCQIEQISQDILATDESMLSSLHSLLDQTHYQSTTKDLTYLLDAEGLQIWVQRSEGVICAALLAQQEGNISAGLHDDILDKKRRLPDQLLPQLLAQTADSTAALSERYLRVVRIAVLPSMRRQKLASRLLDAVIQANIPLDGDGKCSSSVGMAAGAIGASFAADAISVAFWTHHGFAEFHRGFKSNPRTGRSSVAMMRCFGSCCENVFDRARAIHHANVSARHVVDSGENTSTIAQTMTDVDKKLLVRFSNGKRSMHDTFKPLFVLLGSRRLLLQKPDNLSQRAFEERLREQVRQLIRE